MFFSYFLIRIKFCRIISYQKSKVNQQYKLQNVKLGLLFKNRYWGIRFSILWNLVIFL